jgi:diacylglycerol kinase (ATP)
LGWLKFSGRCAGLPKTARVRTCVIFNPTAKGDKARRFRANLDNIGAKATLAQTTAPQDARRLAKEAVELGFELVVAAGGDGTLNEVLNGIGDAPQGFERACLGVLPLGTVNVFAREVGIPADLPGAWETLLAGCESRIDLPRIQYGEPASFRYFAQLAGAGLDARAIELVDWPLKKKIGSGAYVVAGFKALRTKHEPICVSTSTHEECGELILVGNGQLYGGNYQIFPNAKSRDGLLEVCVFPKVSWSIALHYGASLLVRGALPLSAGRQFQAEALRLTSPAATPLQVDGELVGHLPASFTLVRDGLRVITPVKIQ